MKKERFDAYANYYYKVKVNKNKKAKFLSILFIILSILIVVFFSISFSNFLVVAKVVNINTNYMYENRTLYAISLATCKNTIEADEKSKETKFQGGAGYIYKVDDSIKILSSIYDNKKDALKVKDNLKSNGIESEIIEINLPKIDLEISLSSKSREVLNSAVELFYSSYKNLYNLSVLFDSSEKDFVEIKKNINELINSNDKVISDYNNNFNQASNVYILYGKIYLNKLSNILLDLQNLDESTNFSSELKHAYCKVIDCYLDFYNEMI